jgi:hypothetical protein
VFFDQCNKYRACSKWIGESRERRSSKNARYYIPSPQSGDKGGYVCDNVVLELMLEH